MPWLSHLRVIMHHSFHFWCSSHGSFEALVRRKSNLWSSWDLLGLLSFFLCFCSAFLVILIWPICCYDSQYRLVALARPNSESFQRLRVTSSVVMSATVFVQKQTLYSLTNLVWYLIDRLTGWIPMKHVHKKYSFFQFLVIQCVLDKLSKHNCKKIRKMIKTTEKY